MHTKTWLYIVATLCLILFALTPVFIILNLPNSFMPTLVGAGVLIFVLIPLLFYFKANEKRKYEENIKEMQKKYTEEKKMHKQEADNKSSKMS